MKLKVVHLTSAHPRYDIRIFIKMCSSLADKNVDVSLIVADGGGDELKNNVKIIDVGAKGGRLSRMTKTVSQVFSKARVLDADVYHLHDPELIPIGLKLKKMGKIVVFDAHEDLPNQIRSKPYLNGLMRVLLSWIFEKYETFTLSKFNAVVSATETIKNKFIKIKPNSITINNYPILGELSHNVKWQNKKEEVCYLGVITKIRGIKQVISSLGELENVRLNLAGTFAESSVKEEVKSWKEWNKVNELGLIEREHAARILSQSKIGIVTFLNCPNHFDSQPNKMFEYMSAGLPIVASNFPLWKDVVEVNECGICVDPEKPEEIAKAIKSILADPEKAQKMSDNGKNAVLTRYNWNAEQKKLFELYEGFEK